MSIVVPHIVCCMCERRLKTLLLLLSWRAHQALPIWGDKCPEEIRNSTRLWIRRDPSLPRDSWQPFYWLGHHSRAAVVAHSWRIVDHCQTIDVDDVDKLSSCSRFSDYVVGFTGQKTQPTASKYWRSDQSTEGAKELKECLIMGIMQLADSILQQLHSNYIYSA